ncbi:MAG: SPOR domain-containing protein [Legionellaceae bacterium]
MKFILDERLKHRLTGVVVIISIAIIFVPAMIKRSNQRLEESINVSIQLPPKPSVPTVNVSKQEVIFDTIKVAHVDIPAVVKPVVREPSEIAKISEPLPKKQVAAAVKAPTQVSRAELPAKLAKTISLKEGAYGVQLASFGQQENAQALVNRLRGHGYQANYNKVVTRQGAFYKVVVGQVAKRGEAESLQKRLAQNMQLRGFVIKTDV